jgi:signal peptidase I
VGKDLYRVIRLRGDHVAIVDSDDYRRVVKYKWHVHRSRGKGRKHGAPYARAYIKGKMVYMHRFIMNEYDPDYHIDHRNFWTLDNRKENLLNSPKAENMLRKNYKPKK